MDEVRRLTSSRNVRVAAEGWAVASLDDRLRSQISGVEVRRFDRRLADEVSSLMRTADGQTAMLLLGASGLVEPRKSATVGSVCRAADRMPRDLDHARQRLLADRLGCSTADDQSVWSDIAPSPDFGCHVMLGMDGALEVMGEEWVRECWAGLYQRSLEGYDARDLSDVLSVLMGGPQSGALLGRDDAQALAVIAGRAWRFGGGVTPFESLDAALTVEASWLARMLAPSAAAVTPLVSAPALETDAAARLLFEVAGIEEAAGPGAATPLPSLVENEAALQAATGAVNGVCPDGSDWQIPARRFLREGGTHVPSLRGLILGRLASCAGDAWSERRVDLRATQLRREVRSILADDVDRTETVIISRAIEELCSMGYEPGVPLMKGVAGAVRPDETIAAVADEYDFVHFAALLRIQGSRAGTCGPQWWSLTGTVT